MHINIIKSYRDVVAICDAELLGQTFEEGNFQIFVKENFYTQPEAERKTKEEVLETIRDMKREDATFNIVGEKAIDAALEAGIITEDEVGEIQGIPFALVLI